MSSTDRLALINLAAYKESKWNLHPAWLFLVTQTVHLPKCYKQVLVYMIEERDTEATLEARVTFCLR